MQVLESLGTMVNPDEAVLSGGDHLARLLREVEQEFFARSETTTFEGEMHEANTLRVVAVEVFESLTPEAHVGILSDLFLHNDRLVLGRDATAIFSAADSPCAVMTDLVCEVVWQILINDPLVLMEDERRELLAGGY